MATHAAAALTPGARATRVKARARALGFAAAGIADLAPIPHGVALDSWLALGYAGTMRYMHRQAASRKQPEKIIDGARFAVVVLYNYAHGEPDSTAGDGGRVAKYARGVDYHVGLAPALADLAKYVKGLGPEGSFARAFVDAGPVPERELAQRAGLGWIGKNTMLIDPSRGSYTFIASVLTDVTLAVDAPFEPDRCGTCTRCLEACPTDAFPTARMLDANRCLSYLTIEARGPIPPDLIPHMEDWIFGCDLCQDVCPWNHKFARGGEDTILRLDRGRARIPLGSFADLDETSFATVYGWTPLERPGLEGMRRNAAAVAARNRDL